MRLLRAGRLGRAERRVRWDRLHDAAMREAVIVLWRASGLLCGKRLPHRVRVRQAQAATRFEIKLVKQRAIRPRAFSGDAIRQPF
jgi:hypothetical protein